MVVTVRGVWHGWTRQMLRDYYGRAPPSFFDCCNAATGRSLMYTSVARLGIDSAATSQAQAAGIRVPPLDRRLR